MKTKLDLADSALQALTSGFAGEEFFLDFVDKAAVLLFFLARNHPLLDGNGWLSSASRQVLRTLTA